MDSLINSMMLRKASMPQPFESLSPRATREFTNGLIRSSRQEISTPLASLQASVCPQKMYSTQQVERWKKKMKPPKCTRGLTVTSAQESREHVTMTGRQIHALPSQLVTFRPILSVTASRNCLTVPPSPSCPRGSTRLSPRQLS